MNGMKHTMGRGWMVQGEDGRRMDCGQHRGMMAEGMSMGMHRHGQRGKGRCCRRAMLCAQPVVGETCLNNA